MRDTPSLHEVETLRRRILLAAMHNAITVDDLAEIERVMAAKGKAGNAKAAALARRMKRGRAKPAEVPHA